MASTVLRRLGLRYIKCRVSVFNVETRSEKYTRNFVTTSRVLAGRLFTEKHEWINVSDGVGTVGISEYAQDKLGEVVYVQLPETGIDVEANGEAGCLESVKAASEIYSPVSGSITEINQVLANTPNLINDSPYEKGWLFKIKLSQPDELKSLMDEDRYKKFTESQD
ncbi:hypothetical protein SNE40_007458 [Patella caerulea]|uniref:Glycine cleavage system H protein n=1 Tax=Patella caerulea TaxID=87958 RepID=A0AAN8JXR6_PATCE